MPPTSDTAPAPTCACPARKAACCALPPAGRARSCSDRGRPRVQVIAKDARSERRRVRLQRGLPRATTCAPRISACDAQMAHASIVTSPQHHVVRAVRNPLDWSDTRSRARRCPPVTRALHAVYPVSDMMMDDDRHASARTHTQVMPGVDARHDARAREVRLRCAVWRSGASPRPPTCHMAAVVCYVYL